jgi:hypothetical protein
VTGNNEAAGAPNDPAFEKVRRKMVRLLAISIAVLFVGLIAVLSAVVYRTKDGEGGQRAAGTLPPVAIGAGARVVATALNGDNALLTVEAADGTQSLVLLDLGSGTLAARYPLSAVEPPAQTAR